MARVAPEGPNSARPATPFDQRTPSGGDVINDQYQMEGGIAADRCLSELTERLEAIPPTIVDQLVEKPSLKLIHDLLDSPDPLHREKGARLTKAYTPRMLAQRRAESMIERAALSGVLRLYAMYYTEPRAASRNVLQCLEWNFSLTEGRFRSRADDRDDFEGRLIYFSEREWREFLGKGIRSQSAKPLSAGGNEQKSPISEAALREWFERRVAAFEGRKPPIWKECWQDAQAEFPNKKITKDMLQRVRREATPWKSGRR